MSQIIRQTISCQDDIPRQTAITSTERNWCVYFEFIIINERTIVYLNSESYSRSISSHYLSFTSDFSSAFLSNSLPLHKCKVSEASTSTPFLTSLNAVHVLTGFQETRDYLACSGLQKEKNRSSLEFTERSTKVWPLLSFIHILSCRFKSAWSCNGLWSSTVGWRMMSRRCWTT